MWRKNQSESGLVYMDRIRCWPDAGQKLSTFILNVNRHKTTLTVPLIHFLYCTQIKSSFVRCRFLLDSALDDWKWQQHGAHNLLLTELLAVAAQEKKGIFSRTSMKRRGLSWIDNSKLDVLGSRRWLSWKNLAREFRGQSTDQQNSKPATATVFNR